MSKITFRADDDLVRRLEEFDASKSEVMREALRSYLDGVAADAGPGGRTSDAGTVDDALLERVDQLVAERLDAHLGDRRPPQDINVNVTLDGAESADSVGDKEDRTVETGRQTDARKTAVPDASDTDAPGEEDAQTRRKTCAQCGEKMGAGHVYCPNCGEKAAHRIFCECGDELRSDWAFCPSCGRRTPAADVLDRA